MDFVEHLSDLEPFGANNPSPVFVMKNLTVKEKKIFDEVNKFDDEIFCFDELRRHLLRFKSNNFDNKIRKYCLIN